MPWGAAAIVGGAVIGAVASNSASKTQASAENKATQVASDQYQQTRTDNLPALASRNTALGQLTAGTADGGQYTKTFSGLGDLSDDPGYQFRMDQGMRGVDSGAAARGGVLSGATLKAEQQYGQDYASGEYQNAFNRFQTNQTNSFNRLASVAGLGQTGANTIANAGDAAVNQETAGITGAANANASGTVGTANAVSNGSASLANWYQQQQLLAKIGPTSSSGLSSSTSSGVPSGYTPSSDASWASYTGG